MKQPRIVILGAGPAGLGAAWQLRARDKADVVVVEQRDTLGGNAGSFELAGLPVDYGSHRLHPACDPEVLNDIRALLGGDLLDRPRHGRIRLRGRWIHFPLKPVDLALRLPWSFGLGVGLDALRKLIAHSTDRQTDTFASVLQRGLGRTICRDFYFPYARKMWGMSPEALSPTQARRRVSAGSLGRMVGKVLRAVPGFRPPGAGRFYYPCQGYGQISTAMAQAAQQRGVQIKRNTTVTKVHTSTPLRVETACDGVTDSIEADYVWSTIPLSVLVRLMEPKAPPEVLGAARQTPSRAMVLIYLVLNQPRFSPYDAHYFPGPDIPLTRLSEPKNYSGRTDPADRTVLCGELPCTVGDEVWQASDEALAALVQESLARCGIPVTASVREVLIRRLPHAYPIYGLGYETHFDRLDEWVSVQPHVLTFGRQGLFAHDNTHHALAMAYAAVDCLQTDGTWDRGKWSQYRQAFASHVVED